MNNRPSFFTTIFSFISRVLSILKRSSSTHQLANEQGMTYLLVMFIIILIGISLMAVGQHWSVIMKRDREAELLFRGTRIQTAIERFVADYEVQKGRRENKYPLKLEDLTQKTPKRYLQVVYDDPITGKPFDLIKVEDEIRGVRSSSKEVPLDQKNFKGAATYAQITFQSRLPSGDQGQNGGSGGTSDREDDEETEP